METSYSTEPQPNRSPRGWIAWAGLTVVFAMLTLFAAGFSVKADSAARKTQSFSLEDAASARARIAISDEQAAQLDYVRRPSPAVRAELSAASRSFEDALDFLKNLPFMDPGEHQLIATMLVDHRGWMGHAAAVVRAVDRGDLVEALRIQKSSAVQLLDIKKRINDLAVIEAAEVAEAFVSLRSQAHTILIWTPVVFLIGLAFLGLFIRVLWLERKAGKAREDRFRSLVQHSSDLIVVVDGAGTITYASASSGSLLGFTPDEITGSHLSALVENARYPDMLTPRTARPGAPWSVEASWAHHDDSQLVMETVCTDMRANDNIRGIVLNSRDVTDRKKLEEQLTHEAFHDPLTGLPNRALFWDRISLSIARSVRSSDRFAVLFLDIDNFKRINDGLGHTTGDHVLRSIAERLKAVVRPGDTVSRMGGDEFAILADDIGTQEEAEMLAHRVIDAIRAPLSIDGRELVVQASAGIVFPDAGEDGPVSILRDADLAMYRAKTRGGGRTVLFDASMEQASRERLDLETELRRACDEGSIEVHYQPVVDMTDASITGVEALARWNHPEQGPVGPDLFIPIAEETGLIIELGRHVLERACTDVAAWNRDGAGLNLCVNLSPVQIMHPGLHAMVRAALDRSGIDPMLLTLEVTEGIFLQESEIATHALDGLRAMGIRLALDDFGTGYSSLGYLHRFGLDVVKIDRSFITDVAAADGPQIARAVIGLGKSLGIDVVAEGVETQEQADALSAYGCPHAQGYLFGKPMEASALSAVLRTEASQLLAG